MYCPDLTNHCGYYKGPFVRTVGWLAKGHVFSTGPVPESFIESLVRHIRTAWLPVISMGVHFCEFCPPRSNNRIGGSREVLIPTSDRVYIAPDLIVHYVKDHDYHPPDEFIQAVEECPEQGSEAFMVLIRPFLQGFGSQWQEM